MNKDLLRLVSLFGVLICLVSLKLDIDHLKKEVKTIELGVKS